MGRSCTYTTLENLFDARKTKPGKKVNVYGVICSPVTTDKKDPLHHIVEITDESIVSNKPRSTVHVSVFSSDTFPAETVFRVGRILRVQRGVVESQKSDAVRIECRVPAAEPSSRKTAIVTWVVFGEKTGAIVAASSEYYTLSASDNERVEQLVKWNKTRGKDTAAEPKKSATKAAAMPEPDSAAEPKRKTKKIRAPPSRENPPAKRKKIELEADLLPLDDVYPSPDPFACAVFVVDSTRIPLARGKYYYDLIVWDGSGEPYSGELADDCSVPEWCENTTRGPFMHIKVSPLTQFFEIRTIETAETVSSVSVLDVDCPLVHRMLLEAECDMDDVHEFMEDLQHPPEKEEKVTSSKAQKQKRK